MTDLLIHDAIVVTVNREQQILKNGSILIQRGNPALSVSDECSDRASEPRNGQGVDKSRSDLFAHQKSSISGDGRESRKLRWQSTDYTINDSPMLFHYMNNF